MATLLQFRAGRNPTLLARLDAWDGGTLLRVLNRYSQQVDDDALRDAAGRVLGQLITQAYPGAGRRAVSGRHWSPLEALDLHRVAQALDSAPQLLVTLSALAAPGRVAPLGIVEQALIRACDPSCADGALAALLLSELQDAIDVGEVLRAEHELDHPEMQQPSDVEHQLQAAATAGIVHSGGGRLFYSPDTQRVLWSGSHHDSLDTACTPLDAVERLLRAVPGVSAASARLEAYPSPDYRASDLWGRRHPDWVTVAVPATARIARTSFGRGPVTLSSPGNSTAPDRQANGRHPRLLLSASAGGMQLEEALLLAA